MRFRQDATDATWKLAETSRHGAAPRIAVPWLPQQGAPLTFDDGAVEVVRNPSEIYHTGSYSSCHHSIDHSTIEKCLTSQIFRVKCVALHHVKNR